MARDIRVELGFTVGAEEIEELDFEALKQDIDSLKEQPIDVLPRYKDQEIDYRKGHRTVEVGISPLDRPHGFVYSIVDSASVNRGCIAVEVGRQNYTQRELRELRATKS